MTTTELPEHKQRIPLMELQEGDFVYEVESLPPAPGARRGVRGAIIESRVIKFDRITGEFQTRAMANESFPLVHRIRYRDHSVIIKRRDEA